MPWSSEEDKSYQRIVARYKVAYPNRGTAPSGPGATFGFAHLSRRPDESYSDWLQRVSAGVPGMSELLASEPDLLAPTTAGSVDGGMADKIGTMADKTGMVDKTKDAMADMMSRRLEEAGHQLSLRGIAGMYVPGLGFKTNYGQGFWRGAPGQSYGPGASAPSGPPPAGGQTLTPTGGGAPPPGYKPGALGGASITPTPGVYGEVSRLPPIAPETVGYGAEAEGEGEDRVSKLRARITARKGAGV